MKSAGQPSDGLGVDPALDEIDLEVTLDEFDQYEQFLLNEPHFGMKSLAESPEPTGGLSGGDALEGGAARPLSASLPAFLRGEGDRFSTNHSLMSDRPSKVRHRRNASFVLACYASPPSTPSQPYIARCARRFISELQLYGIWCGVKSMLTSNHACMHATTNPRRPPLPAPSWPSTSLRPPGLSDFCVWTA